MASDDPEISVVIPVYDEAESLPTLLDSTLSVARSLGSSFEIVLVDDGSGDGSSELMDRFAREHTEVRVVRLDRNWGLTSALDAGFRNCRGEVIVTLDADLQNDPGDIPALLDRLRDHDMVCGWRRDRHDPWLKKISSRIANAVRNRLSDEEVHDTCCPLKVMRREVVERIRLYDGLHRFLPTLARWEGFRIVEVPVTHRKRRHGRSKYGVWNRVFKGWSDLRTIRWMKKNRLRYRCEIHG